MATEAALDSDLGLKRRTMDSLLRWMLGVMVTGGTALVLYICGVAVRAEQKNIEQDGQIKAMAEQILEIRRSNERMESKLDRVLERVK